MSALSYQVVGDDMQFVELTLHSGQSVRSEAGAFMYMTDNIEMSTHLGNAGESSVMGKIFSAGKRLLTQESMFTTLFSHSGSTDAGRVSFAAPYPGKIVPMELRTTGTMLCQKRSFLCSTSDVQINIAFTKRLGAGFFGGEGFILQRISGAGLAFVHAGGTIKELNLSAGESLKVDTGCIVAFQESVAYEIEYIGSVTSALFGGEGVFLARLRGPGKVYIQSLPFSRIADEIIALVPRSRGRREDRT